MNIKKWLCAAIVLLLLFSLMPTGALAVTGGQGVITGRQEGKMEMSLAVATASTSGPSLAPGNHERWIDRIDQLPSYAASFYSWMETNAQPGGLLTDPTKLTPMMGGSGKYDSYMYRFHTIKGSASFTYTGNGQDSAAQQAILEDVGNAHTVAIEYATAAYGSFDRDHPEVFWLNGRTLYGYSIPYNYTHDRFNKTGTVTYSVELYFIMKTPEFDIRNQQYQSAQAVNAAIQEQNTAVDKILEACPQGSAYEQVRYLNETLTHINAYNSVVAAGNTAGASVDAWKSISALTGRTGVDGPVCEGYARALMILCRELGIPCVLAEGDARSAVNGPSGAHMWNYVKLKDAWYAVDVTWNDPYLTTNGSAAVSGYESDAWLLVGSKTQIMGMSFDTSHILTNNTTLNSLQYTNGPILSENAYVPEPEPIRPTLTLKAPTLEFKDMICINVFYTAENIQDVVEMGMITYSTQVSEWSVDTADHVISGASYDASTDRYYSASQGIHAKYLGDTVYMAIYAKLSDGSYDYTKLVPYSPITYATNQLKNSTNTELKQLVAAMLNYGAAAQSYFGHNTDALANSSLTAEQLALPEIYRSDMIQSVPAASQEKQGSFYNNKGFSKRSPAVSFEGAFSINYFFTPNYAPVEGITLYYWDEADYHAAEVLTAENATGSIVMDGEGASQYRGDITGISAKNLSQAVYVAAVYSDGTTTWTSGVLGYSIGAYCASQATKDGTMADLAMATAVYGYHAKQYFG